MAHILGYNKDKKKVNYNAHFVFVLCTMNNVRGLRVNYADLE